MIHNGIEYGVMQAYAEGFDVLNNANSKDLPEDHQIGLNIAEIAEVWRRGSVIGSWLLDLASMALAENPTLSNFTGFVQDSGEGRWTIQAALEEAVPAEVLTAALYTRFRSRQDHTFAEKMLSAMRNKFGGHVEAADRGLTKNARSDHARGTRQAWQFLILTIFGASSATSRNASSCRRFIISLVKALPANFALVGFAFDQLPNEAFRDRVLQSLKEFGGASEDCEFCKWLLQRVYYIAGDFHDASAYARLKDMLASLMQNIRPRGIISTIWRRSRNSSRKL